MQDASHLANAISCSPLADGWIESLPLALQLDQAVIGRDPRLPQSSVRILGVPQTSTPIKVKPGNEPRLPVDPALPFATWGRPISVLFRATCVSTNRKSLTASM